jgi:predicted DNA-binding protein YlxM (UPF0122 family)
MNNIEFFTDPATGEALFRKVGDGVVYTLSQGDTELIKYILGRSEESYPEQYQALCKEYERSKGNKPYYNFLRARRLINCCFGAFDGVPNIDESGGWRFSKVKCPLMAECKYYGIICSPKFNVKLSERELQVMELYFQHLSTEEIAEKLYLSIHTVVNHRKNSLAKLNLHGLEEFRDYVHNNNLFKNQYNGKSI